MTSSSTYWQLLSYILKTYLNSHMPKTQWQPKTQSSGLILHQGDSMGYSMIILHQEGLYLFGVFTHVSYLVSYFDLSGRLLVIWAVSLFSFHIILHLFTWFCSSNQRHLQIPARRSISPWLGEWGSGLYHSATVISATALCCQEMLLIHTRMVPHDNTPAPGLRDGRAPRVCHGVNAVKGCRVYTGFMIWEQMLSVAGVFTPAKAFYFMLD